MSAFSRNGAAKILNRQFPAARVFPQDLRVLEKRNEIPPVPVKAESTTTGVTRESYYLAKAFMRLLALKHGIDVSDIEEAQRVIASYEKDRKNEAYRAALATLGAKGGK